MILQIQIMGFKKKESTLSLEASHTTISSSTSIFITNGLGGRERAYFSAHGWRSSISLRSNVIDKFLVFVIEWKMVKELE